MIRKSEQQQTVKALLCGRLYKFFTYILKIRKYIYATLLVFLITVSSAQARSVRQLPKMSVKTEEKKAKKTKKNSGKKKTAKKKACVKKSKKIKKKKKIKKVKKASTKKTIKAKKAKKKNMAGSRITLRAGDIAINQKSYIRNYDRVKSSYICSALINYTADIDVSSLGYHLDVNNMQESLNNGELRRTYTMMLLEYPELIHVDRSFNAVANTETGLVTHIKPVYTIPQNQYSSALKATYAAADRIAAKARKKKNTKDRIKAVDSAIREKVSYKMTGTGVGPYGALVKGKAFCMGYARAVSLCMNRLNIPCAYEVTEQHVWNRVKVNGKWYVEDATYNDADDIQLSNLLSEKHTEPEGIVV